MSKDDGNSYGRQYITDANSIKRFADAGFNADMLQADFVAEVAEKFVDYLRDEAAHTLQLRKGNHADVIRSLCRQLERDGFDTSPTDDGDAQTWIFAPGEFVMGLRQEVDDYLSLPHNPRDDSKVSIDGVDVYVAPELDAGELIAIQHETVVPTPTLETWKPWLVRHPEGVVVGEVDE